MALFALLSALSLSGDAPISCQMTAQDTQTPLVLPITVKPVPSLKDQPDSFRIVMHVGKTELLGHASSMPDTAEDDMMFRANATDTTSYILGLRNDGAAAMYVAQNGVSVTLTGWCDGQEPWFRGWLQLHE